MAYSEKRYLNEVIAAYRLATENADDTFYMMRPIEASDGHVLDFLIEDCNEQGVTNIKADKETLIGQKLSDRVSPGYLEKLLQSGRLALAQGVHEEEAHVPAVGTRPGTVASFAQQ